MKDIVYNFKTKYKEGFVNFEKDDKYCIKFIAAAANLRARIFNI